VNILRDIFSDKTSVIMAPGLVTDIN